MIGFGAMACSPTERKTSVFSHWVRVLALAAEESSTESRLLLPVESIKASRVDFECGSPSVVRKR